MTVRRTPFALAAALAWVLVACSGAGSPSAPASIGPSVAPSAVVSSPEEAAARVLAANPGLGALKPRNPDLIGQCCWYEAKPAPGGFQVDVEIGWGDCPSGCIDRHHWTYLVTPAGEVTLTSETGPSLAPGVVPGGPAS